MMDHEHFFKMQRHKHDQDIFHTLLREHEKFTAKSLLCQMAYAR